MWWIIGIVCLVGLIVLFTIPEQIGAAAAKICPPKQPPKPMPLDPKLEELLERERKYRKEVDERHEQMKKERSRLHEEYERDWKQFQERNKR